MTRQTTLRNSPSRNAVQALCDARTFRPVCLPGSFRNHGICYLAEGLAVDFAALLAAAVPDMSRLRPLPNWLRQPVLALPGA